MATPSSPDVCADIVRRYEAGESSLVIAAAVRLSTSAVLRILNRSGIRPSARLASRGRRKQKLFPEVLQNIVEQYRAGRTLKSIADEHGVVLQTVRHVLKKKGVPRRRGGNVFTRATPEQIAEMAALWRDGMSQAKIEKKFGLTSTNVSRIFAKAGIRKEHRPSKRETHGNWKGGRFLHRAGYLYVRIERDDPMWPMANISGYVMEHRLVMARKLGRCLEAYETVHHKDEVKLNNDPENLQVRIGRHGKNAVYECAACGCRDLRAVQID